jgi:hypothetical protein
MIIRLLLLLALLAIVASLGIALFTLTQDSGTSKRTVRALTWRTLLSITLFLLLLLAFALGLVQPHAPEFLRAPAASHHQ